MTRVSTLAVFGLAAALAFGNALAQTQEASAKPAAPKKLAKAKPAASHQKEEQAQAADADTAEEVNANQLDISARVLTGRASCEFNQNVDVQPLPEHPGYFRVAFAKQQYLMVPEETTTGAVRLVDKKAGVIWLQIPVKSMLINTRIGQRMVDACQSAEQRAAVEAASAAAKSSNLQ